MDKLYQTSYIKIGKKKRSFSYISFLNTFGRDIKNNPIDFTIFKSIGISQEIKKAVETYFSFLTAPLFLFFFLKLYSVPFISLL